MQFYIVYFINFISLITTKIIEEKNRNRYNLFSKKLLNE